jgi:hypothetical protein
VLPRPNVAAISAYQSVFPKGAAIMLVITTHMARQQPLHELTQRSLVRRFENEMKVIRHQAEAKHLYLMTFLRFNQKR